LLAHVKERNRRAGINILGQHEVEHLKAERWDGKPFCFCSASTVLSLFSAPRRNCSWVTFSLIAFM
jgi:hypothetical protein